VFAIFYQPPLAGTLTMIVATLTLVVGVGLCASISILQQKPVTYLREARQD